MHCTHCTLPSYRAVQCRSQMVSGSGVGWRGLCNFLQWAKQQCTSSSGGETCADCCSENCTCIALLYSIMQCNRCIVLQCKIIHCVTTTHCSGRSQSAELFTIEWPQLNILLRVMPAHASYCHQSSIASLPRMRARALYIHSTLPTNLLKGKYKSSATQRNIQHHTHLQHNPWSK